MNTITPIWKKTITLEQLNASNKNNMPEFLGIQFTKINPASLEATMPVNENTRQPFGLLHGGASAAFAETIGSMASFYCVPEGYGVVGIELNASHVYSAKNGETVHALCEPIRIGKSHHVWDIRIYNEEKKLCCVVRLTTAILKLPSQ